MANPPAVFLVGYRGSGKSTVGRIVAERLACPFLDSDRLIEERAGQNIAAIFRDAGETAFRDLEELAVKELADRTEVGERLVVGTGGGAVLRSRNVARIRDAGLVFWLTASPEALKSRILGDGSSSDDRPALLGRSAVDEVATVLSERQGLYRRAAHFEVSTEGLAPQAVADEIVEKLNLTAR